MRVSRFVCSSSRVGSGPSQGILPGFFRVTSNSLHNFSRVVKREKKRKREKEKEREKEREQESKREKGQIKTRLYWPGSYGILPYRPKTFWESLISVLPSCFCFEIISKFFDEDFDRLCTIPVKNHTLPLALSTLPKTGWGSIPTALLSVQMMNLDRLFEISFNYSRLKEERERQGGREKQWTGGEITERILSGILDWTIKITTGFPSPSFFHSFFFFLSIFHVFSFSFHSQFFSGVEGGRVGSCVCVCEVGPRLLLLWLRTREASGERLDGWTWRFPPGVDG